MLGDGHTHARTWMKRREVCSAASSEKTLFICSHGSHHVAQKLTTHELPSFNAVSASGMVCGHITPIPMVPDAVPRAVARESCHVSDGRHRGGRSAPRLRSGVRHRAPKATANRHRRRGLLGRAHLRVGCMMTALATEARHARAAPMSLSSAATAGSLWSAST